MQCACLLKRYNLNKALNGELIDSGSFPEVIPDAEEGGQ